MLFCIRRQIARKVRRGNTRLQILNTSLEKQIKKQIVNQDVIDEFHCLKFDVLNITATNESTVVNPKFRKAFEFAIDHGNELKTTTLEGKIVCPHLSRAKFVAIKYQSSKSIFSRTKAEIDTFRQYCAHTAWQRQLLMTFCGDMWDGRRRKIVSLSIMLINSISVKVWRIHVALLLTGGETTIKLCEMAMCGIESAGIEVDGFCRSCTENCPTALNSGR